MVVIQPSTGDILAVANNDGQRDTALTAQIAPGSTDKIITATALLNSGLVSSPRQGVSCPKTIPINGHDIGNSGGESEPAGTPFETDFAQSCNNAFSQWYNQIGSTTLADTAQKYFGLNQPWNIGLGSSSRYYTIPPSSVNGELAMELFGQGQLQASPLAMASVAATVANGSFKQPVLVPGAAQIPATAVPDNVKQALWQMMHAVTQSGTAAGVFSGINDAVYAKTGTADVAATTQQQPNSWMVVFDPGKDIAIGCVVLDAGAGKSYAGPEAASVLRALQ
jgi:cell division protein FtsI/penicillin-binding protein 2